MSAPARNGLVPLTDETTFYTYLRVSSDDQEKDGMSLPVQDDETLGYGAKQPGWVYGGSFRDVETGANPHRRDYERLLATVRADRARRRRVAIVVVKQSRFGRDIEELGRAWREYVKELGVEIHSTRDGGHIKDQLTFLFRGVMNHNELTVISEGVKNSFARLRRAGWLRPGRPPWGYAWLQATDEQRRDGSPTVVAVPHETEADYVRELFRQRAEGRSTYELAAWAQALPESARGGRTLSQSAIRAVLNSPTYVGRNPVDDGDVLDASPGRWEPLCDEQTWRAIHPRVGERTDPVPISTRGEYVLTRFIFCEVCGSRMNGHTRKPYVRTRRGRPVREPAYRTYICASRMSSDVDARPDGKVCHHKIGADALERQLFDQLGALVGALATPGVQAGARRAAREAEERSSATGDARRLRHVRDERKALSDARADLTISLATRQIDQGAYDEAAGRLGQKIDVLDAEIARLAAIVGTAERRARERPMIDVILDQAAFWHDVVVDGTLEDRRALLRLLVERTTPRRVGRGSYVLGLVLTPLGAQLLEVGARLLVAGGQGETAQLAWANCAVSPSPSASNRPAALAHSG